MTVRELKGRLDLYTDNTEVMMEFRQKTGHETGDIYHSSIEKLRTSSSLGGDPYILLLVNQEKLAGGW